MNAGKSRRSRQLLSVLALIPLFFVASRLLSYPERWILALTGVLGGSLQVWAGLSIGLRRFILYGACWATAGVALAFSSVPFQPAMAILFALQGSLSLISGAVVFRRLLLKPVEKEDNPDER